MVLLRLPDVVIAASSDAAVVVVLLTEVAVKINQSYNYNKTRTYTQTVGLGEMLLIWGQQISCCNYGRNPAKRMYFGGINAEGCANRFFALSATVLLNSKAKLRGVIHRRSYDNFCRRIEI